MDIFSGANTDPQLGATLAELSGITPLDLQTPDVFQKFHDVMAYFGRFSDAPQVARIVTRNTPLKERLAKLYEYVGMRKELDILRDELKKYPIPDTITGDTEENRMKRDELMQSEQSLLGELARYEQ